MKILHRFYKTPIKDFTYLPYNKERIKGNKYALLQKEKEKKYGFL